MNLLSVRDLDVTFQVRTRGAWPWTAPRPLQAVKGVSFDLAHGETLGIVGESGSGKSTLARAIVGTLHPTCGEVFLEGEAIGGKPPRTRGTACRDMQIVFQDPLAALNPRLTAAQIIAEPLLTHAPGTPKREVRRRIHELMERVGLLSNLAGRYPHEFSGGQCQRIGIARALIQNPKLVICDEPVSALDVSVKAQVINLLKELQRDLGLALILIAHDLSVIKHISSRILVMYFGRVVEYAPALKITGTPLHPYTRALISSIPIPDPLAEKSRPRLMLEGELPSPFAPPSGCVFRTRCPIARNACAREVPELRDTGSGHEVACPYYRETEATLRPKPNLR